MHNPDGLMLLKGGMSKFSPFIELWISFDFYQDKKMKELFARTGLVLACALAASASANYDITLNDSALSLSVNGQACQLVGGSGQAIDAINVVRGDSGGVVNVTTAAGARLSCLEYVPGQPISSSSSSAVSSISSSSSSSGGTTPPPPGVDLSACGGSWASDVLQGRTLSLVNGEGRVEQALTGNSTISFPAQALNVGAYSRVIINGLSSTANVGREVWISECPGGAPVQTGNCSGNSMESTTIRLWQGPSTNDPLLYCNLPVNKQYFINVKNTSCSGNRSCGFYRTIK